METLSDKLFIGTPAEHPADVKEAVKEFIRELKASELVKCHTEIQSKKWADGFRAGFSYMRGKVDILAGDKLT